MSLMRRKAYVEFQNSHKCTITTPFLQKALTLKDGDIIDLINLKKLPPQRHIYAKPPCSFYAVCGEVKDGRSPYILMEAYAIIDLSNRPESWGSVDLYDEKAKCFEGTIWHK
jgi:hypothetical protein